VTDAVILLAYAAGVGTLGARMLARAGWTARAPLLAIVTYLAAAWSVVAALGLAGLTLAVHATALGGALSQLIGACVLRLRATYATPGGMSAAEAGLVLSGAVLIRTVLIAAGQLRAAGRQPTVITGSTGCCARPNPWAPWGGSSCAPWPPGSCCCRWAWRWPRPSWRSRWDGFPPVQCDAHRIL
jgi:hypothetical protein